MQQSYEWLTGALGGAIGIAGTYIVRLVFDRKKVTAEADSAQAHADSDKLDADTKAVELYERFATQLNPKIEALQSKQEELINVVNSLKIENAELRVQNINLKHENARLKTELGELHEQVEKLRTRLK
jgi:predicted nuclease with TOPRIM domain